MQHQIITIRTIECDRCKRFDSIMLSEREIKVRVKASPLQIAAYSIKHRDHTRIIYFDELGEYLGDTLALDEQEAQQIMSQDNLPFYIVSRKKRSAFQRLRNMVGNRFRQKSLTVTITGPSRAGKTSLTRYLKTLVPERESGTISSVPTMGKSTQYVEIENSVLQVLDMGGQEDFWYLWEEPISQSDLVIFIVDATSQALLETAEAFETMISYRSEAIPVLVILNKKDLVFKGQANKFSTSGEFLSLTNLDIPLKNITAVEASIFEGIVYMENEELDLGEVITRFIDDYTE